MSNQRCAATLSKSVLKISSQVFAPLDQSIQLRVEYSSRFCENQCKFGCQNTRRLVKTAKIERIVSKSAPFGTWTEPELEATGTHFLCLCPQSLTANHLECSRKKTLAASFWNLYFLWRCMSRQKHLSGSHLSDFSQAQTTWISKTNKGAYQHQSRTRGMHETWARSHSSNICHKVEHWAQWGLPEKQKKWTSGQPKRYLWCNLFSSAMLSWHVGGGQFKLLRLCPRQPQ